MRTTGWLLILMSGMIFALGGCSSSLQQGESVMRYHMGQRPLLLEAPEDGRYILYHPGNKKPDATISLQRGQPLGFKAGPSGKIIAVAGQQQIEVPDHELIWRRR